MAAGFGQGISTTPVQQLQALTMIANDGIMVKPHIIDKIVNTQTNEEIKTEIIKSEKLVSTNTINKMKNLMEDVIDPESLTGGKYYLEGYDLIGKTGTAQIYEKGAYLTGANDYIVSIALMYPKENPEIIIYAAVKKPNSSANSALTKPIKELVKNISKYKGMFSEKETNNEGASYKLKTYISRNIDEVKKELEDSNLDVIVIGNGDKIIKQYPNKNTELVIGDKVFLMTNNNEYKMPNIINWSRYDISKYCTLANINCTFKGSGYAKSQGIKEGTILNNESILEIELEKR